MRVALANCDHCGDEFTPSIYGPAGHQRFCGTKCRIRDGHQRRREINKGYTHDGTLPPDVSEWTWDGMTKYSLVAALTYPYVRKCFLCGRHTDVEWITDARARTLYVAGLPSCSVCGGWIYMDLQEFGSTRSPTAAAPARTHIAMPRRVA